jgi:2-C-methyl-D-erythritol 4-phosphate cytidylyltransferase
MRCLGDAPVLVQTLRAFERSPVVGALVVAGPPEETDALRSALGETDLSKLRAVVAGGASRQASVRRAFAAAPAEEAEVLLVHDAVRPFVPAGRIRAVAEAARETGAAAPAVPASDTLRRAEAERFTETVDRAGCFQMQTPQGFRRALLADAFAQAEQQQRGAEEAATDDVGLVQAAGHDVHRVDGDRRNFKITTPADWQLAQALWPVWLEGLKVEG